MHCFLTLAVNMLRLLKISFGPALEAMGTSDTVDGERFAGLNIRGFSAIKVFMEILSRCLGHKCS